MCAQAQARFQSSEFSTMAACRQVLAISDWDHRPRIADAVGVGSVQDGIALAFPFGIRQSRAAILRNPLFSASTAWWRSTWPLSPTDSFFLFLCNKHNAFARISTRQDVEDGLACVLDPLCDVFRVLQLIADDEFGNLPVKFGLVLRPEARIPNIEAEYLQLVADKKTEVFDWVVSRACGGDHPTGLG